MGIGISQKIIFTFLFFITLVFINIFMIQLWISSSESDSRAINLAGQQRMLNQKITKSVFGMAAGLDTEKELDQAIDLFDETHEGLVMGSETFGLPPMKNDEIRENMAKLKTMWLTLKGDINNYRITADTAVLKKIVRQNLDILKNMNDIVFILESESQKKIKELRYMTIIIFFLSIAMTLIVYFLVRRFIVSPLVSISRQLHDIAKGNLTIQVDEGLNDEIGDLGRCINRIICSQRESIAEIQRSTASVSSALNLLSVEVEKADEESDRQEEQMEYVSAASEEMSQTVTEIAQNSLVASSSSDKVIDMASIGRDTMDKTVSMVNRLSKSSSQLAETITKLDQRTDEVGSIISLIKDIADQTNLLALNASIEAARAGDAGRGFAVVADEVRKLSEKTMSATLEIDSMITLIQDDSKKSAIEMQEASSNIQETNTLMSEASKSFNEIANAVSSANGEITQIAAAMEEQYAANVEITDNVLKTSEMAQSITKRAKIITREISNVSKLMADLRVSVDRFQLGANSVVLQQTKTDNHTPILPETLSNNHVNGVS